MMSLTSMVGQMGIGRNSTTATPSLALILSDRKISCFVWGKEAGQSQIYSTVTSGDWGGQTLEELVVSADGVTSAAINQVSGKFISPPTQVALAVPYSWVDQSGLSKEKSLLLANLTRKLGLMASGFIVIPEAIAWYLKDGIGVNSCLLIQVEENDLYISLVRQSKVVSSAKINRSDNVAADVEEGVFRLDDKQPLPPVAYLTGSIDLSEVGQKLTNYPWPDINRGDQPVFLQLPKFEATPADFEAKAIITQITGNMSVEDAAEPVKETPEPGPVEVIPEAEPVFTENLAPPPILEPTMFGFARNQDVEIAPSGNLPAVPVQALPMTEEGNPFPASPTIDDPALVVDNLVPSGVPNLSDTPLDFNRPKRFAAIGGSAFNFFRKIGRFTFKRFSPKKTFLFFIPLFLLVGLFFLYRQVASAEVRLLINSQKQNHKIKITLSDKVKEVDKEKLILPIKSTEVDLSGSGTTDVRGSKKVGDPATGEVTIYNGTSVTKSFAKGTLIKSASGLKFSLNDLYTIPAKSTDLTTSPPVDKWGEKQTAVTAADIGTEYNLAANSTFNFNTIASSSGWLIKNQNAFSNGTSRQVQAVDESDRERLSKEIIASLTGQAGSKIEENTKNDQGKLLVGTIKVKQKTDRFDHAVGEEAETLKLEQSAVFTGQYYRSADLFELINASLSSLVPVGYQQKPNYNEPVITVVDQTKGIYEVSLEAEYIPLVDIDALVGQLRAKKVADGETIIESIPNITGFEVDLRPLPFSWLKRFPLKMEKIAISLVAK